ncbi:MAG: BrnA antitoxin family protein [Rhodocyclaceae bacterium]|nr:BrnA antitoxin family protein [Rhodocyclaceae bacterium]
MTKRLPVIDDDGEVGDLSEIDPTLFMPFSALPESLQTKLRAIGRGRPKAAVTKERITIRLSPDVTQSFRATGPGWQTRIDAALRDWLKSHSPA